MRQYIKKQKIDSLDLKYLVPKKLTIHKTKTKKKDVVKLPPISPSLLSVKKEHKLPKTPKSPSSPRSSRVSSASKTEKTQTPTRSISREKKKGSKRKKTEEQNLDDSDEVRERITKVDQKQGPKISHLCEVKLTQILQKYKPNMSEIYEKTFEFEDFKL